MSGDLDLEQRYRRVLRLLPDYYRDQWEDDMVAAFLDGWLTGDPDEDSVSMEFDRPTRPEMASVVGLAARLYLGGAVAPLRRFAWGQAVRSTVLAVMLFHAMRGLGALVVLDGSRRGWLPAPAPGIWTTVWYAVGYVWIAVFVALVLGYYREARVLAVLAIVPDLVVVVQMQLTGALQSPSGSWASWILLDLAPVLAMAAFHRGARPVARWPWLLALPAGYLLVFGLPLATAMTTHPVWLPDPPALCCILVTLLCLAHAPRAWSGRAGTGMWSLALLLLAAVAGVYRIASLAGYQDPHLIHVGLAELLILLAAAGLVAPDAARAPEAMPAPPASPHLG
jgi:hypothetical protein